MSIDEKVNKFMDDMGLRWDGEGNGGIGSAVLEVMLINLVEECVSAEHGVQRTAFGFGAVRRFGRFLVSLGASLMKIGSR